MGNITLTQTQKDIIILVIFGLITALVVTNIPETQHTFNEYFGQ